MFYEDDTKTENDLIQTIKGCSVFWYQSVVPLHKAPWWVDSTLFAVGFLRPVTIPWNTVAHSVICWRNIWMNGQINDRIKLKEETVRHRRKDSRVDRLGWRAQKHACAHMGTRRWQGCQDCSVGKGQSFQQTMRRNWASTCNRTNLDSSFSRTKSNAKWIKYLKVKSKAAKLLEEYTKEASWRWSWHGFTGHAPKAQPAAPRPYVSWTTSNLKLLCINGQSAEWKGSPWNNERKYLQMTCLKRRLVSQICKKSHNSTTIKTTWLKNEQRTWTDISAKKWSLIILEMQIKTLHLLGCLLQNRWANNYMFGKDVETLEPLCTVGGNVK